MLNNQKKKKPIGYNQRGRSIEFFLKNCNRKTNNVGVHTWWW